MQIVGRSSSLFTRVPRVLAHALGLSLDLVVVPDLTALEPAAYGGNPALKIPTLVREDGGRVFGALNVARALAARAPTARIVWPEDLVDDRARNAHELLSHAMAAQVQLIMGTIVGKLDAALFAKARRGLEGALAWLDANVDAVVAQLPARDASWFEHALGCTVEHLGFRQTIDVSEYRSLGAFAARWGESAAARATTYRFDQL